MNLMDYKVKMDEKAEQLDVAKLIESKNVERATSGKEMNDGSLKYYYYSRDADKKLDTIYDGSRINSVDGIRDFLPEFELSNLVTEKGVRTPYRGVVGNFEGFEFWSGSVEGKYELMDFGQSLDVVEKVCENIDFEVREVSLTNDKIVIDGIIPDMNMVDDNGMKIWSGVRMVNGVGGKAGFSMEAYTNQEWCTNGCSHKSTMSLHMKHTQHILDVQKVQDKAQKIINATATVFDIIKGSQSVVYTAEEWQDIRKLLYLPEKLLKAVDAKIEEADITAYQMWRDNSSWLNDRVKDSKIKSVGTRNRYDTEIEALLNKDVNYILSRQRNRASVDTKLVVNQYGGSSEVIQ